MPGWKERGALATLFFSDKLCSYLNVSNAINYWFSLFSVHLHRTLHRYLPVFVFFYLLFSISSDDQLLTPSLILKAHCVQCANRQHYIYTRMKPAGFHPPTHPRTNTNTQELEQQELSWTLLICVCVIRCLRNVNVLPSTVCWAHAVSGNIQHLTINVRSNSFNSLFTIYKTFTDYSRISLLWNENIKKHIPNCIKSV